jgi:hypothetical protein
MVRPNSAHIVGLNNGVQFYNNLNAIVNNCVKTENTITPVPETGGAGG